MQRAHLDTTTIPAADSLSPRRRSGERVREGDSKERDNSMQRAPLPPPSPRSCLAGRGATSAMVGASRCALMRPVRGILLDSDWFQLHEQPGTAMTKRFIKRI